VSHGVLLLVAALSVTVTFAASPSSGLAVANRTFQADKSSVFGNTTLFGGSLIETAALSSGCVLHNGVRLRLGSESRARVHPDRLVLEKGRTGRSASSGSSIEALGLRIAPESLQSRLAVTYSGLAHVRMAALLGGACVSGLSGVLIAAVPAGTAGSRPVIRVLTIPELGKAAKRGGGFWHSSEMTVPGVGFVGAGATTGVLATRCQPKPTMSAQ